MPLIDDHVFDGPREPFDAPCRHRDCGQERKEHASALTRSLAPQDAAERLEAMHTALARNSAAALPSLSERLELFYRATGTSPRDLEPSSADEDDPFDDYED
jgi:hypothetical protein